EVAAALAPLAVVGQASSLPLSRQAGSLPHGRRRLPGRVGGLAVLVLVGALTAWLTSRPSSSDNPAPVDPGRVPGEATAHSGPVRVVRLDVRHFARVAGG